MESETVALMLPLVLALNLTLVVWAILHVMRHEPKIYGPAARVRWCFVGVGLVVAATGMLLKSRTLLSTEITFFGYLLASLFFVVRSLSLQIVSLWTRLTSQN